MYNIKRILLEISQAENKETLPPEYDTARVTEYLKYHENEGRSKPFTHNDIKQLPTIGYGHLITPESTTSHFPKVFAQEISTNPLFVGDALAGRTELSDEQMTRLLKYDVDKRVAGVRQLIPNFDKLPKDLQDPLFSEYYRGSLGKSPKSVSLINQGKYSDAAAEYLDNDEYNAEVKLKAEDPKDKPRKLIHRFTDVSTQLTNYQDSLSGKSPSQRSFFDYAPRQTQPTPSQPIVQPQTKDDLESFVIKPGDTLSKIEKDTGVSIRDIMKANPEIKDADKIQADQKIRIPKLPPVPIKEHLCEDCSCRKKRYKSMLQQSLKEEVSANSRIERRSIDADQPKTGSKVLDRLIRSISHNNRIQNDWPSTASMGHYVKGTHHVLISSGKKGKGETLIYGFSEATPLKLDKGSHKGMIDHATKSLLLDDADGAEMALYYKDMFDNHMSVGHEGNSNQDIHFSKEK